jgi:isopentenyl diphosphate isomerase/L-lactate dehydrogenase-like FMN-dependent dehydrogenase
VDEKPIEQMSLNEIHDAARRMMPPEAWDYVMGAADSGSTMARNVAAFKNFLFRQRIFHRVTDPDTTITLFGRTVPTPALVAPIGSYYRINETAEREVADGASRAKTILFVSYATRGGVREWAEGTTAPLVYIGYMREGREQTLKSVRLAEELGYVGVGLVMDSIQPQKLGDIVPLTRDGQPRQGNPARPADIEWLKTETSLPVVIKGILSDEDARVAVEAGADAIAVSNHGGRIFDQTRAAIEVLPEVVQAVGKRVPVVLDGGVRNGGDIVKALALGAKAALVGRPICWGVAAGGASGVKRVIESLTQEVKRTLVMTGVGAVSQVTESILIRA